MKKKWIICALVVVLLAVLFVPIPQGMNRDGGTQVYTALTYKIVSWRRLYDDGLYEANRIYWFSDRCKSLDQLWEEESASVPLKFTGTVVELAESYALIQPLEGESERASADLISVSTASLSGDVAVNDLVEVTYTGGIMETYPAKVHASSWHAVEDSADS